VLLAGAFCTAAWSQTTPNWGALGSEQAPAPTPAASALQGVKPGTTAAPVSALGSKARLAASAPGTRATTAASATVNATNAPLALPPVNTLGAKAATSAATTPTQSLAELLKRPDTDVITSADGKKTTVGAIRKQVAQRQAVQDALRAGKLPPGWKATKSATVYSPQRAQLLSASVTLRNLSRTEAAAALKAAPQKAATTSPSVLSPLANKAAREPATTAMARPKTELKPGIFLVNGKHKGVQFTPGGTYTIDGLGFGTTLGQVDLVSKQFPTGSQALQVSTQWSDGQVQAILPETIRGVPDMPVTLRVTTRDGTLFSLDAQFYAAREELTLSMVDASLPAQRLFKLDLGRPANWPSPYVWTNTIGRGLRGDNINCPSPGRDTLTPTLSAGWNLASVTIVGNTPAQPDPKSDEHGDDGSTTVTGSYGVADWKILQGSEQIVLQWAVFRSHTSPTGLISGGADDCTSNYSIQATLIGPAGLKPF
jgi:hypothetical protein